MWNRIDCEAAVNAPVKNGRAVYFFIFVGVYMAARKIHSTTVIAVRRNGKVAMAGDGQVTAGNTVVKGNARKVRKIYDGKVLTGFAGSVADAFTLFDKFEEKLKE